jgi:hypothetical protein
VFAVELSSLRPSLSVAAHSRGNNNTAMGILSAADANTPLKSKARRWLSKKPPSHQQHAQMPGTPIASSESPAQGSAGVAEGQKSPESLLGTAMRSFEKDEKLGVTFQDTGERLALQVIGLKVGSQGLELGVKVRGCLPTVKVIAAESRL